MGVVTRSKAAEGHRSDEAEHGSIQSPTASQENFIAHKESQREEEGELEEGEIKQDLDSDKLRAQRALQMVNEHISCAIPQLLPPFLECWPC
jgi:hypothetical protein